MEENKDISPIIIRAIEIMKTCFGGTEIELLSDKMYRKAPDEFSKAGKLGVDIKVMGIVTFLGCESLAEDIACTPYGQMLADEFVSTVIREGYPEIFK